MKNAAIEMEQLGRDFAVCKLESAAGVDVSRAFTFLAVTDDEISLVCEVSRLPPHTTEVETGWKGLKIRGVLDFGMVGVIAGISHILAERGISIFVVSTFNTDYIFLCAAQCDKAVNALRSNGYIVV